MKYTPEKYLEKCLKSLARAERVAASIFAGERQHYLLGKAQRRVERAKHHLERRAMPADTCTQCGISAVEATNLISWHGSWLCFACLRADDVKMLERIRSLEREIDKLKKALATPVCSWCATNMPDATADKKATSSGTIGEGEDVTPRCPHGKTPGQCGPCSDGGATSDDA